MMLISLAQRQDLTSHRLTHSSADKFTSVMKLDLFMFPVQTSGKGSQVSSGLRLLQVFLENWVYPVQKVILLCLHC